MYKSLTTKYRPKVFRQMVGQDDIPVIKAVIEDADNLPPLLLFCGPSGVGKTTAARIVASYLNCPNRAGGEPCAKCPDCEAVIDGSHVGVYELDAATNGSAEKLRDLVTKSYLSSNGVKVFIIDESQAISSQGWNVLLKVLEEPPPNCIFMLLTSEPKKVPPKIRTRALKFTFKPVSPKTLGWYLGKLCEHADITASSDDIDIITEFSGGSVREALSMLEQSVVVGKTARGVFADKDRSLDYLLALISGDLSALLTTVDAWWDEVGDAVTISSQLATTLEKLAFGKVGADNYRGDVFSDKYIKISDGLQIDDLVRILTTVSDWYMQLHSKAQLVMLSAKLNKVINGETSSFAAQPQAPIAQEPKADTLSRLQGL